MKTKLMFTKLMLLIIITSFTTVSCQQKGGSEGGKATAKSDDNDSIKVNKAHFNKDPKQPVEWEVTMKKAPDGTYFRHGESLRYTPSGKLAERVQYVNNKKEGARIFYYTEGPVWKEQYYKNGVLHGDCKRYGRKKNVEAEYSYSMGDPVVGLKEYTNTGKLKPNPTLVVTQNDEIKATGYHRVTASISGEGMDRIRSVEFFEGALLDGKIADEKKLTPFKKVSNTKGEMLLSVPKGTFINTDLNIVAIATTKSGLKLVLTNRIHVAVRGV